MPANIAAIEADPAADDADDQSDGDEPQEDLNSAADMIEIRRLQKSIQDASNAVSSLRGRGFENLTRSCARCCGLRSSLGLRSSSHESLRLLAALLLSLRRLQCRLS